MTRSSFLTSLLSGIVSLSAMTLAFADDPGVAQNADQAAPAPLSLKLSNNIEAGAFYDNLTGGYGDWTGVFVRGVDRISSADVLNGEIVSSREFGSSGTLMTLTDTHDFTPRLFGAGTIAASTGGFYLPSVRGDVSLSEKWLAQSQLVTSVGGSAINWRDGHQDRALTLGSAYYFTFPFVAEAGLRANWSSPGDVLATSYYVAGTYGEDKVRYLSLRLGFGKEGYEVIGPQTALADFSSEEWLFTWREWLAHDQGIQLRVNQYFNPAYHRTGIELAWFHDF
jgi:YaiO family outer membrane protein